MKRTFFGTLAAVALLATPAVAQDGIFAADAPGFNWFNSTGQFTFNYGGLPAGIATGSSFDIFCVQRSGSTNDLTQPYDVFVTEIDPGSDFSNTAQGAYSRYYGAAWIVENWFANGQPNAGGVNNKWQWAAWMLTAGVTDQAGCEAFAGSYQCNDEGTYAVLTGALTAIGNGFDPALNSTWWVISDAGTNCIAKGTRDTPAACQEFIFYDPSDPPQEIVPEPATMTLLATGLAGMAAANRRRRNKK